VWHKESGDSIVHGLNNGKDGSAAGWSTLKKMKSLLDQNWNARISHMYCESNIYVDILANLRCTSFFIFWYKRGPKPNLRCTSSSETF